MMTKSWIWPVVAGMVFLLLAPSLVWLVVCLVKGNRQDILATVSVAGEHEINLPAGTPVVVLMELPTFASDLARMQIELTDKQTGHSITMKYSYVGSQGEVHGVSTRKIPFGRMTAERGGTYLVRLSGLEPGKDYSDYRVIFSRPYLGRMALQIIGIIFCAVGMLLCAISAAWSAGLMKQGVPPR